MNIVAVTACPTGIAHTYMAAEKLTDAAMSHGHDIKVETQGAMGVENPITETDVKSADIAIFAVDTAIEDERRFCGLRSIRVPVADAIRNPKALMAQLG